jgi:hypothetical protein
VKILVATPNYDGEPSDAQNLWQEQFGEKPEFQPSGFVADEFRPLLVAVELVVKSVEVVGDCAAVRKVVSWSSREDIFSV